MYSCTSLAAIIVDPLNTSYISVGGVLFDKGQTTLIQCPGRQVGDYTIPNSVTRIGDGAFTACSSLTNLTIPSTVTSIADSSLASCASLRAITVDALNTTYVSVEGVLFDQSRTVLIQWPGGKPANFEIPNTVTKIGASAFSGCTSLTSLTIPPSVRSLGSSAFSGCTSLTNLTIPPSVTSVGPSAFTGCTSLTRLTIPNSVTNIGGYAFDSCPALMGIYFMGNAPSLDWNLVGYFTYNATVYYLPGTTGWSPTYGRLPTAPWLPRIEPTPANRGAVTNQFGFNFDWVSGSVIVVEACTNLTQPVWLPLATNTLTGAPMSFIGPQSADTPARFYRLRSP